MDEIKEPRVPAEEESAEETPAPLSELDEMKAQYEQMREIAARAQADGINYRNWAEREMKRLKAQGSERAVLKMLPVFDNLERALASAKDNPASVCEGVSMIKQQFLSALTSLGVAELNPVGEAFSPLSHDAMGMVPVSDPAQDGRIQTVVQRGFQLADKVIRPATVMVGRYTAPEKTEETE
ncbi:MAG: nucleotide exchange factor GrpE [Pyramidobacter sp.]|nr:nucleotide exchange factor GrpE [Pyramidobacter sp.]